MSNYIFLDYPKNLNQINVYLNTDFNSDNNAFEVRFQNINAPDVERDGRHPIDYRQTLANFLAEHCGGKWALADENQQGMRGWFEFSSGETLGKEQVAMIYLRSETPDNLTNIATKRDGIKSHRIHKKMGQFLLLVTDEDGEYSAGHFDSPEEAEKFFNYYIARDPSKTVVSGN